jgi:Zn-finger nucleic acid-binding protein
MKMYEPKFCGYCGRAMVVRVRRDYRYLECPKWFGLWEWVRRGESLHSMTALGPAEPTPPRFDPMTGERR